MLFRKHGFLRDAQAWPANEAIRRSLSIAVAAPIAVFAVYTALRAVSESWNNDAFPDALAIKLELLPLVFPVHMVTGGLALLLVPAAMLLRGTQWHRWMGRITAVDVALAGVTAVPVALEAPVTLMSAAGFVTQGLVWMALCAAGIWNIRRGNADAHRRAMLLMAAVTSGAMFFRIYLALWAIFGWRGGFKVFYACDAWMAWGLPLLVMVAVTRPRKATRQPPSASQ
jgi:uncharacterized membrane protein